MTTSLLALSAALGASALVALSGVKVVRAESPYERDQREQLEKYQQQRGLSPQQLQVQRWQQEWQEWDRQYDLAQQQKANDYLKGVAEAGELSRTERQLSAPARRRWMARTMGATGGMATAWREAT